MEALSYLDRLWRVVDARTNTIAFSRPFKCGCTDKPYCFVVRSLLNACRFPCTKPFVPWNLKTTYHSDCACVTRLEIPRTRPCTRQKRPNQLKSKQNVTKFACSSGGCCGTCCVRCPPEKLLRAASCWCTRNQLKTKSTCLVRACALADGVFVTDSCSLAVWSARPVCQG